MQSNVNLNLAVRSFLVTLGLAAYFFFNIKTNIKMKHIVKTNTVDTVLVYECMLPFDIDFNFKEKTAANPYI